MAELLFNGPAKSPQTLILAHGAGAPMDSDWMNAMAEGLAEKGIRIVRFEFAYMAARRQGQRKPPPRAEKLMGEYLEVIAAAKLKGRLFIGGKSMGGRVASLVAAELFEAGTIEGLVCLGYPFHPPGEPEKLRTEHLKALKAPTLICQGTRDVFGGKDEIKGFKLSKAIEMFWLEDGDHGFLPRKKISGRDLEQNLDAAMEKIAEWMSAQG